MTLDQPIISVLWILDHPPTRKSFETTASCQLSRPQLNRPQKQRKSPIPAMFDDAIYRKLHWRAGLSRGVGGSNLVLRPRLAPWMKAACEGSAEASN